MDSDIKAFVFGTGFGFLVCALLVAGIVALGAFAARKEQRREQRRENWWRHGDPPPDYGDDSDDER